MNPGLDHGLPTLRSGDILIDLLILPKVLRHKRPFSGLSFERDLKSEKALEISGFDIGEFFMEFLFINNLDNAFK